MASIGYAIAGGLAGLGDAMVDIAEQKREEALLALRRQWQQEDRAQDREWNVEDRELGHKRRQDELRQGRAWDVEDRDLDREWDLEDDERDEARANRRTRRAAGALEDVYGGGTLFDLIDATEGAGDPDTLYGHAQREGGPFEGVRVSQMTIGELTEFSDPNGKYGQWVKGQNPEGRVSTPMGRNQIVGTTLLEAAEELGYDENTVFTEEVQQEIARHLAMKRISGPRSMAGKRAALREEWPGLKKVDDAALDQAIRELDASERAFTTIADEETPESVRDDLRYGLGIGKPASATDGYANVTWATNEDGETVRIGLNKRTGVYEEIPGADGYRKAPSSSSRDRTRELSAGLDTRLGRRFKDEYDEETDWGTVDAVKEEIARLMADEGLTESEAERKAIAAMVYEEEETTGGGISGFLGLGPEKTTTKSRNKERRGTWTGEFDYGDRGPAVPVPPSVPEETTAASVRPSALDDMPVKNGLPAPTTREQFAALPPGTRFMAPDGSVRVKP